MRHQTSELPGSSPRVEAFSRTFATHFEAATGRCRSARLRSSAGEGEALENEGATLRLWREDADSEGDLRVCSAGGRSWRHPTRVKPCAK